MLLTVVNWIQQWIERGSVAEGLAILSLAIVIGLFIGTIRVRRMRLGIPGVLFAALVFGQIGLTIDAKILDFLRDFSLILFMYAIGLQVGPGFFSSLRTEGLRLNLLSVAVLVVGALLAATLAREMRSGTSAGLYTGAFTSTPGLGAAQEALKHAPVAGRVSSAASNVAAARAGLAYSITYPFGVIGPVLVIVLLRRVFRVNLESERAELIAQEEIRRPPIETADFEVTSSEQTGLRLREHPLIRENRIVLSRVLRDGVMTVPTGETIVKLGDIYRAIGPRERLSELVKAMGVPARLDVQSSQGDVERMDVVVTRTRVLRRTLRDLDLPQRFGVTVTRVTRNGLNMVPTANLRLAFADQLIVLGPKERLKQAEAELGNCLETLNRPQLVPIFLGIVLGVIIGSIPLTFPGLNAPLRIGLAGGPLLGAIALSQLGNIGSIVWYMPAAANQLFRDFGLAVFLACVGLQAGDHFVQRALEGGGEMLLLWGAVLTIGPVLIVAIFARVALKMNFLTITGWVAGAMTSSTALLFADELGASEAPAVAYAAVAPLATLVPIFCAQGLAILGR